MPPKSKPTVNSVDEQKETGILDNDHPEQLGSLSLSQTSLATKRELFKAVERKLDEPLTAGNHKSWFNSVQGLLDLQGLWDLMSQQLASLKRTADDEEVEISSSSSRSSGETEALKLIWYFIYGSIKTREFKSAVDHIPKDQPGRLWINLKELCGGLCEAQVERWAKQLCNIQKLPSESVTLFTGRFQTLATDLAEAGRKVPEKELRGRYLDALGSEYQALTDAVILSPVPTTLDRIQGLAREYEMRLKKPKVPEFRNKDGRALAVSDAEKKSKVRCFKCDGLGHYKKDCTSKKSETSSGPSKCDHCQKTNHLSENCVVYLKEQLKKFKGEANLMVDSKQAVILDSGANNHFNPDGGMVDAVKSCEPFEVRMADGNGLVINQAGTLTLPTSDGRTLPAGRAYVDSRLFRTLVSVSKLCSAEDVKGIWFDSEGAQVLDEFGSVIMEAEVHNGLYYLQSEQGGVACESVGGSAVPQIDADVQLWHHRLGHLSYKTLSKLINAKGCSGLEAVKLDKVLAAHQAHCVCEACVFGKGTKARKSKERSNKATEPLGRCWLDIQGPFPESEGGKRYLLVIIDEASRRGWAFGLTNKSDAAKVIIDWIKRVTVELGKQLKELRCDRGGEFLVKQLKAFLTTIGAILTFTQEYTPHHRGIVERFGRTIVEMSSCMLQKAKAVKSLWLDAAALAVEIHNKALIKKGFTKTPMELWNGSVPDLKHMRVFGCDAWYHVPTEKRKKLDSKGRKGMFIGFSEETLGWRILDTETMQVKVSKDVVFMEHEFTASEQLRKSRMEDEPSTDFGYFEQLTLDNEIKLVKKISKELHSKTQTPSPDESHSEEPAAPAVRRSTRATKPPNLYAKVSYGDIGQAHAADGTQPSVSEKEPSSFEEILHYGDYDKSLWLNAIKEEEKSLHKLGVLADVAQADVKPIHQVVKCRLIFKNKLNSSGNVARNKVRVVAKGYTQREGIDYNETFAPVLQYKSLRTILSIVANLDLEFKQLDIKTAFLYAPVEEDIQIVVPEGFTEAGKVKKLMKALYGIKQAPHQWNGEIDGTLRGLGYHPCISDCCVYFKRTRNSLTIFVTIFVDDITLAYHISDEEEVLADKKAITDKYEISDLGDVEHLLGMRITRDRSKKLVTLDQSSAVEQLLKLCKMDKCTAVKSPEEPNAEHADLPSTNDDSSAPVSPLGDFRSLVGSLNYLAGSTRPDIAHVVGLLCRKVNQPSPVEWRILKRVLRYLRGTTNLGLSFSGNAGDLGSILVYTDADWAGDKADRRSTSGTILKVNGNVVLWGSKKQTTVALSSAESEYMALGVAVQEALWMRSFLDELGFKNAKPTIVKCDNQAAIAIAENPTHLSRTKHIDIRHHFIRDHIKSGSIKVEWISTQDQLADIMTKGLGPQVFLKLQSRLMSLVQ